MQAVDKSSSHTPPPAEQRSTLAVVECEKYLMRSDGIFLLLPEAGCEERMASLAIKANPYPEDAVSKYGICPFSGLLARYRDPLTGIRYGSLEAFKKVRAGQAAPVAAAEQESVVRVH